MDSSASDDIQSANMAMRRMPSLGNLPPLPSDDDDADSALFSHSEQQSDGHIDSLDESRMARHLEDVESSFVRAPSPLGAGNNPGVDDTYLFDAAQAARHAITDKPEGMKTPEIKVEDHSTADEEQHQDQEASQQLPEQTDYSSPAEMQNEEGEHTLEHSAEDTSQTDNGGNTTASLETMSSSPTAAAAARTVSRAISMASMGYDISGHEPISSTDQDEDSTDASTLSPLGQLPPLERTKTPHLFQKVAESDGAESSDHDTVKHEDSSTLGPNIADAGATPGGALLRRNSSRRPKFLRSRHGSQRSSISSHITTTELDEPNLTSAADYAVLSGGALPAQGLASRHSSFMLSRQISLGSIASGIDDSLDFRKDSILEPLDEERASRRQLESSKSSTPTPGEDFATPKAKGHSLAAPTDTVIARHVRNVHVPDSVAKEYRTKSGVSPSGRLSTATNGVKNMTLKEQSSTIDRLSKENFDLKLKVMFLSDRLDKLSDEGVKEMISENVEMKTVLANMQRDNKALRKKIKELESAQKNSDAESLRPSTARSGSTEDRQAQWFDEAGAQEREEEIYYLRERIEEYEVEIEKMRRESLARETEKRKLAEVVKSIGQKRGEDMDAREEMDVWKDLLEQETARREQSDEDNRKLREEIFKLKSEQALPALNHTTNVYNITKRRQLSPTRARSVLSDQRVDDRTGALSAASTLVDEYRKECEQLRHENAELRREVGAQTSMLTSRNREKERLYQEIEELKLGARRNGNGSIAGDSILERSASRAHERSHSRGSGMTRITTVVEQEHEAEREDLENKNAELRDQLNAHRLENQELRRELDTCMEDFEVAVEGKRDAEQLQAELQAELESAEADILTMQMERDEALKGQEEVEIEFEALRKEAQEEIDALEAEAEQRQIDFEALQAELANSQENFGALQLEMRSMSEALVRLEDDHETKSRRIQELEQELADANRELDEYEKALNEAKEKINRLTVQQESSQGEIAFLREEQDADKIKIGDLETALRNAETSARDSQERVREIEQRLANERHQRDLLAGKEKQEVQKYINDLNREVSTAKDDARRLRKTLGAREVEATEWKERLIELENNLREALGDLNGTRSSFLKGIADLQMQLDHTTRELDDAKRAVAEKSNIVRQRDGLLEENGMEVKRLAELLDKERAALRNARATHEAFLKTHQHTIRKSSQSEDRVVQLEQGLSSERRRVALLESQFKEQLTERNQLLLNLWNRLSAVCGSDWRNGNSLINGRALPSLEAVSNMFPGFSKNLLAAVKNIEGAVSTFKNRVRQIEKELYKEVQQLEHALEQRTKKLERLEFMCKAQEMSSSNGGAGSELRRENLKLQDTCRLLRMELAAMRAATPKKRHSVAPSNMKSIEDMVDAVGQHGSPAPSVPTGPRNKSLERSLSASHTQTLSRTSTSESLPLPPIMDRASSSHGSFRGSVGEEGEQRWVYRLKELERRLKAEREARLLDRSGARKRLEEEGRRNEELRRELEQRKIREELEGGGGTRAIEEPATSLH
jgi:chromosome segregation ATPase